MTTTLATSEATKRVLAPAAASALAASTINSLSRYFASKGHRPSEAMWEALIDLAAALEAMALGTAAPKFFLSSLDPGVGKTQTIIHFIDTLLSSPAYDDVGVMLCVGRLSEIETLQRDIAVPADNLAVLTSNDKLNALGHAAPNDAQVLITTQQRIEKSLNGRSFNEASGFFYRGKPRAVRVWDESYLPGQTITLNRDDVAFLFKPLRYGFPALTEQLEAFFVGLRDVSDGTTMSLPDFATSVDLNDVLALFDGARDNGERKLKDDQRMAISSLWYLSGKAVTIRKDGPYGNTVIDYKDTLPEDLAPMVILDASGRVRETYRDIEESRGTLVRLKSATKRYDKLTVNLWRTGGGKRAFYNNGDKLVEGIAKAINTKPNERWLVVVHRPDSRVGDVVKRVNELLTVPNKGNVSFISWGQHMATNEFVDVSNVILAGTLFYRPSYYEALKRLSAGRSASAGAVTQEEIRKVMVGEHAHSILQALCRGSVRRCDGAFCQPCDAYIIASAPSGIPNALPNMFPGCQVKPWRPVERTLTGHVKAAVEFVEGWAKTAAQTSTLPFKEVAKALGITSHSFNHDVRSHSDFEDSIAELGVVEWGKGQRFTAFAFADQSAKIVECTDDANLEVAAAE
jgi:hypothetical protein